MCKSAVLNSSPRTPPLCTFRMLLLSLQMFVLFKSSKFYCQFFHMYSTYIQRIEIALLSDPWRIQLTLNTDSRHSNTDKYSLTICTYKLYRYTNEDIVEKRKQINKKEIK